MDRLSTPVGIILAGGRSRRFGSDKAWALCNGEALVHRLYRLFQGIFEKTYVVLHQPDERFAGMEQVFDVYSKGGPMNGIYSALLATRAPSIFVAACDLPWLGRPDIEYLLKHWESTLPALVYRGEKTWEPLCGIYNSELTSLLCQRLQDRRYRLQDLLTQVGARGIEYAASEGVNGLANMNTPEDYQKLKEIHHAHAS